MGGHFSYLVKFKITCPFTVTSMSFTPCHYQIGKVGSAVEPDEHAGKNHLEELILA